MRSKWFPQKLFIIFILIAALSTLVGCSKLKQIEEAASTLDAKGEAMLHPTPTPVPPEPEIEKPAEEPNYVISTEYVSATEFFSVKAPNRWSIEEDLPGADLIMANSEAALDRFRSGSSVESGDFVVKIGFLPLALLEEKDLAHLGFQFGSSPEVFLTSLLPLFRINDEPAGNVVGEATLVAVSDGRDAGMLALLDAEREGMILMFEAGDGVIAFISTAAYPGEMSKYLQLTYAIAAEVAFKASQDTLYKALYGG